MSDPVSRSADSYRVDFKMELQGGPQNGATHYLKWSKLTHKKYFKRSQKNLTESGLINNELETELPELVYWELERNYDGNMMR